MSYLNIKIGSFIYNVEQLISPLAPASYYDETPIRSKERFSGIIQQELSSQQTRELKKITSNKENFSFNINGYNVTAYLAENQCGFLVKEKDRKLLPLAN